MSVFTLQSTGALSVTKPPGVRLGALGRRANNIDYTNVAPVVRAAEKALIGAATGLDARHIVMLNQVHGDTIVALTAPPTHDLPHIAEADGLITRLPDIALVIRTADCVPVFAYDPETRVLGAAHSGWRGCRLRIASALIRQMVHEHGARAADIRAYVLPAIGPGSYAVNEDVAGFFPEHARRTPEGIYLDLWTSVAAALCDAGVAPDNVYHSALCTLKNNADFFSHRCGDRGRNLNYGYLLE